MSWREQNSSDSLSLQLHLGFKYKIFYNLAGLSLNTSTDATPQLAPLILNTISTVKAAVSPVNVSQKPRSRPGNTDPHRGVPSKQPLKR